MSRKRGQDSSEHGGSSAKRVARASETIFRLLIPATKIGKVIGKQGVQIRQLREETTARIKIADTVTVMSSLRTQFGWLAGKLFGGLRCRA